MNTSHRPTHWTQCRDWSPARIRATFLPANEILLDPRVVLKALDVTIQKVSGNEWSGAVSTLGDSATVLVNPRENTRRQTFTLAHELGHLLLHTEPGKDGVHFRDKDFTSGDPLKEAQANRFARELLMPRQWIYEFRRLGMSPQEMADQFGVSLPALQVRLGRMLARGQL